MTMGGRLELGLAQHLCYLHTTRLGASRAGIVDFSSLVFCILGGDVCF